MSSRDRGGMQNIHTEDKSLSLSMPKVMEEEMENESFSETEFTAPKRRRKYRTKKLGVEYLILSSLTRKDLYWCVLNRTTASIKTSSGKL